MITPVKINGHMMLAIAIPELHSREDVNELRDAMLDVLSTCMLSEETKECTSCESLYLLVNFIKALVYDTTDDTS